MVVWVSDEELEHLRAVIREGHQWKLCDVWGVGGPKLIKGLIARIDRLEERLESAESLSGQRAVELLKLRQEKDVE